MNNKKLAGFSLLLALVTILPACGGGFSTDGGYKATYNVDGPNKTKISVGNFGGGIGHLWIEQAADRFAELCQDKSFADGKKGVYIKFTNTFNLNTATMGSSSMNMYFDERFSDVTQLAQQGLLLNLDSIVKDETRQGGSLASNIFDSARDGLMLNGSYYGLPHYEYYGGLSYNREIFDEYAAYFAASESEGYEYESDYGTAYFVNDLTSKKSVGPDGVANTQDDGLPATLEEMLVLFDYIKYQGCAPIVISGQYQKYADYLLSGLWSALAGSEQMRNYYNCTGEIEVVDRDSTGKIIFENENLFKGIDYIKKPRTKKVTMAADGSQGYLGNDMAAKFYAISMLDIIYNEDWFNADSFISTRSHYDAQKNLYLGDTLSTYDKAAMLIEGSYWYNESDEMGCFDTYERYSGKKESDLDVRWMPLPTAYYNNDPEQGDEPCLLDIGQAYAMINGNIANNDEMREVCLEFMKFLYSEKELAAFTTLTGMPRMIKYTMSDNDVKESGNFYSHLWELRDTNGSNVIGLSGETEMFKKAKSAIKISLQSSVYTTSTNEFILQLLKSKKHAAEIFEAFAINPTTWRY